MRITSVTLNNFQSYADETIDFEDGISLLHGDNGAGKSTVLRAIFGGLFQTDMRTESASDFNSIADLVRKGEEDGSVVITFDVDGNEYTLTWKISVDDPTADEPTGTTDECLLESPILANPISGITSVRSALQDDILGMDAKAFVNSVYVQQNEVMKLITATESERKKIFDDLLGLSRIDEYIERTDELRLGAKDKREEAANRRDELQRQLEHDHEDRETLVERQQALADKLRTAKQKREELANERDELRTKREEAERRIENYDELEAERDELEAAIENFTDQISTAQAHIEEREDEIDEAREAMWGCKSQIGTINSEVSDYDLSTAEAAAEAEQEVTDARVEASQQETEAQSTLDTAQSDLSEARDERSDLESALETHREQESEAEAAVERATERVSECESHLEEARDARDDAVRSYLPSPPESISQDTKERVESHIAELDERREELQNELTRQNANLSNAREAVTRLEGEVEDAESDRDDVLAALPDDIQHDTETDASDSGGIVETRVDAARSAIDDLETVSLDIDFDNRSTIETARDTHIPDVRATLDDRYSTVVDTYAELSGRETHLDERLSEYARIKRTGDCPVCGESVASDNDHHVSERDAANEELVEVQCDLAETRSERETLEADRDRLDRIRELVSEILLLSTLRETETELTRLQAELTEKRDEVESGEAAVERVGDEISTLKDEIKMGRETVLPTFETVEEKETALENAREIVEEKETALEDAREQREETEHEIEEQDATIEEHKEAVADAEATLEEAREQREAIEATVESVQEAIEHHDERQEYEQQIEHAEEAIENKREVLSTYRESRSEKQVRLDEVEEELDVDLDEIRAEYDRLDGEVESATAAMDAKQDEIDDLNGRLSDVEGAIESYDRLSNRIDTLDHSVTVAARVYGEMKDLVSMYEDVKARLRTQNIKLINSYANKVFRDLYQSQSYEQIILNEDYSIRLLKSDGTQISPKLSSGGESAIANIALRAGVYRTIAERNQTIASGLPPFILDEPTTFLDSGHVQELERAIENIRDWNVEQVIIVSHDASLIDSADFEYRVTKEPTTDQSSCTKQTPQQLST